MSEELHGGYKMVAVLEQEMEALQREFLLQERPEFSVTTFFPMWEENCRLRKLLLLAQREYYLEQQSKRQERRSYNDLLETIQILNRQHASERMSLELEMKSLVEAKEYALSKLSEALNEIEALKSGNKEEGTDA